MTFAQRQRAALIDLMRDLGPFAATLNEGWQTQDLAAHLYVREHRPVALLGIGMERFQELTQRIQNEELHSRGFDGLLDELKTTGWVMRPLDKLVNTSEYYIHHEDVLRANGRSQTLSADEQQELWPIAKMLARKTQLKLKQRLVLKRTDTGDEVPMGQGTLTVHLEGLPSELLLLLSGRDADVKTTGEPGPVAVFRSAISGL